MGGPEGPSSYTRRPPSSTNILYFQKYALAAPVEDDPIVNPQEAGEGVSRFREAVLCDITAGFSKRYRRGAEGNTSADSGDDSGGGASHKPDRSSKRA
jgi:hypothetical protein